MPKSPQEMTQAIVANLPAKTGRTLEQWVALVQKEGPATRKERHAWLKSKHGLGHVTAQVVASEAEGRGIARMYADEGALLKGLFAGASAAARPVYEAVVSAARGLSPEVKVSPCKTYVALRRSKQFAILKPDGEGGLVLGLALGEKPVRAPLKAAKGLGGSARITHQLPVALPLTAQVHRLLAEACEAED